MSIFKRKKQTEPQSGPKVFTPEDYARLMSQEAPAAPPNAPGSPEAPTEPGTPNFDSISPNALGDTNSSEMDAQETPDAAPEIPTVDGLQLTEDHPEKTIAVSSAHSEPKVDPAALEAAIAETEQPEESEASAKPRRISPFEDGAASLATPEATPEPVEAAEPPPMPTVDSSSASPAPSDTPSADSTPIPIQVTTDAAPEQPPAVPEAVADPEPPAEPVTAAPVPAPAPPEAAPAPSPTPDPAMSASEVHDLAKRVSQALVDLEELRVQKEQLEQSLQELQAKHSELENKIEQQRKIATELLDQVHMAL